MGLDMYLMASRYCGGGWDHAKEAEKAMFEKLLSACEMPRGTAGTSCEIIVQVGYWRKANAIHAWFVSQVQDGVDECQTSSVPRTKLEALLTQCQTVLDNRDKAADLMPPMAGFFFGSVDVGDGYFADMFDTVAIIKRVLALPDCWSFSYRASW